MPQDAVSTAKSPETPHVPDTSSAPASDTVATPTSSAPATSASSIDSTSATNLQATDAPLASQSASTASHQSSNRARHNRIMRIASISITAVLSALIVFFMLWLIGGSELLRQPGEVIFDPSLTEVNRDFITENLGDVAALELESDVQISVQNSPTKLDDDPAHILYEILVPVTDFYNPISFISTDDLDQYELISIWNLKNSVKLLAIDDQYYLDTLNSGAIFQYYVLSGDEADLQKIQERLSASIATFPTQDTILTFAQTGVTALSRDMNTKLKTVGDATFFAAEIADFLSSFDLTHTSNESSFFENAPTTPSGTVICSEPAMIDALLAIGLDIVELTGNHNQDCGDEAAISTIDTYHLLGIQTVGGGKTAAEAAVPLRITEKASAVTLLAYNLSTGGYTLDDTPGANFYTEDKVAADIAAAKAAGDTVIVDVQYYECNAYASAVEDTTCDYANSSAGDQIGLFRHLIDLGADVVIGTAAHQPQTYELYGDGVIYYGLGNLFFDQALWPGTSRSLILVHYFYDNELVQTRIVPTMYGKDYQTKLLDSADAAAFIERLNRARPGDNN